MILETPIPGLDPWEELKADRRLWRFGFHQPPGLPEKLLAGRQFIYLPDFLNRWVLDSKLLAMPMWLFMQTLTRLQITCAREWSSTAPFRPMKFNAAQRRPIDVPVVLASPFLRETS